MSGTVGSMGGPWYCSRCDAECDSDDEDHDCLTEALRRIAELEQRIAAVESRAVRAEQRAAEAQSHDMRRK